MCAEAQRLIPPVSVLNSKQFARRWRACNPDSAVNFSREDDEEEWRIDKLELLAKVHTLGGIAESGFDVVESNYAVSRLSARLYPRSITLRRI